MTPVLPGIISDLRFALRQMRKQPGMVASAIVTLALGIGASTAVFSLLYEVLLKSLPYSHPDRIVFLHNVFPKARTAPSGVSTVDYVELKKHPEVFSDVAEYYFNDLTLTGAGTAQHMDLQYDSACRGADENCSELDSVGVRGSIPGIADCLL